MTYQVHVSRMDFLSCAMTAADTGCCPEPLLMEMVLDRCLCDAALHDQFGMCCPVRPVRAAPRAGDADVRC